MPPSGGELRPPQSANYVQPSFAPPGVLKIGRINSIFSVDAATKTMWVKIHELKGLQTANAGGLATLYVRVYVLPAGNKDEVVRSLFARGQPSKGKEYKRWTVGYSVGPSVSIEEDFDLDLSEAWEFKENFRVYFAVMASSEGVAADGTDFLGCMSVSLKAVCDRAEPVTDAGGNLVDHNMKRPRWFHLLGKLDGLSYEATVVQQISSSSGVPVPALSRQANQNQDLFIEGRDGFFSNSMVNDIFHWQPTLFNNRPTYRGSDSSLHMYYLSARGVWAIGHSVGSLLPCAYLETESHALPQDSRATWFVYSQERTVESTQTDSTVAQAGIFQADVDVRLSVQERGVQDIELTPAQQIKILNEERALEEQRGEWRMTLRKDGKKEKATKKPKAVKGAQSYSDAAAIQDASAGSDGGDGGSAPIKKKAKRLKITATVTVPKGEGIGIGVQHDKGKNFVTGCKPGGNADKCGAIEAGDEFYKVNATDVSKGSRDDCIAALKAACQAGTTVTLVFKRNGAAGDEAAPPPVPARSNAPDGTAPPPVPARSNASAMAAAPAGGAPKKKKKKKTSDKKGAEQAAVPESPPFAPLSGFEKKVTVKVPKGEGLGVGVLNYGDRNTVSGMKVGGNCEKSGKLEVGDMFLKIGGKDVQAATREDTIAALKAACAASTKVVFEILRGEKIKVTVSCPDGSGIGVGVMNEGAGNFVRGCQQGGNAFKTGKFKTRDWIVSVNGQDVMRAPREECIQAMKNAKAKNPKKIEFVLLRGV